VPDEASERAAAQIAALADSADERTLVLVLISGGGSSLIAAPSDQGRNRLTLADLQETTRQLLACGAEISELNCIRKHLFLLAGGRLARRVAPAPLVGLVMSDVVGDDLQTIASGPTCSDETTFDRALAIIDQYGLTKSLPANVVRELSDGAAGLIAETPKPASAELSRATNILVATNLMALRAAENEAKQLGYHPLILTSHLAGEAREVARFLAAVAKDVATSGFPCARPACILAGGETTVTVRGKGKGGRNQELALAFLREMQKEPRKLANAWLLSFSTDGEDGPTDAAGGFASARMAEAARRAGLRLDKALHDNDSHTVLEKLEGLFVTGETDTNVADIQIIAVT
ncbi:MAG TPA: DUF4147 domain-containing protein, partial [Spirochaetia bacterium]|nr:DUF4147 domain-containing protein [Spirochaetia bacterium]